MARISCGTNGAAEKYIPVIRAVPIAGRACDRWEKCGARLSRVTDVTSVTYGRPGAPSTPARRPASEEHSAVSTPQPRASRRAPHARAHPGSRVRLRHRLPAGRRSTPRRRTTIPYPKPSRTLPSALDVAPRTRRARCASRTTSRARSPSPSCSTRPTGSRTYGILRTCAAEHGEGRALDWMINANNAEQLALANALTRWLAAPDAQGRAGAMAKRFGINYIIWNRQQWRAYDPARGWAPYYGVSPHTDHIHFSFNWDGARKRSSWWSGVAVTTPLTGPQPDDPAAGAGHHGQRLPPARAGRHRRRRRARPEGHRRHRRRQVRPDHGDRARHVAVQARRAGDQEARQRRPGRRWSPSS